MGKVLLLIEVARLLQLGRADSGELLLRDESARAFDSGIWQYLEIDRLPLADVARLVGIASDNWATNVLLSRVGGVESLAATAAREAIHGVVLHDRVRDARHLSDPDALSTGSASAYVELLWRLHRGTVVDVGVVSGPRSTVAYAVIANWNAAEGASTPELAMVLASMRRLGLRIRGAIGG